MLQITIPAYDKYWDDVTEHFVNIKEQTLCLEHSLISISRWEAKWHKPFMSEAQKTNEELIDYIKCMTMNQGVDPLVYQYIPESELSKIQAYIDDDHTATWFNEERINRENKRRRKEILTSEVIYYYMITLNIPVQFEKWHLGRLMTLIKVCNEKNKEMDQKASGKSKVNSAKNTSALAKKYHDMNAARRAQLGTKG